MDASNLAHPNERLRQERLHRNWRQREVADQLGTTAVTVNRWERGSQQPSAYFRVKLCALFGKSAEELGIGAEDVQSSSEMGAGTRISEVGLTFSASSSDQLQGTETETNISEESLTFSVDPAGQLRGSDTLSGEACPGERVAAISSLREALWSTYTMAAQEGQNHVRILQRPGWLEAGQRQAYIWLSVVPTAILFGLMVSAVWVICHR